MPRIHSVKSLAKLFMTKSPPRCTLTNPPNVASCKSCGHMTTVDEAQHCPACIPGQLNARSMITAVLDHALHPEVFRLILSHADARTRRAIRATCRDYAERVAELESRHLLLTPLESLESPYSPAMSSGSHSTAPSASTACSTDTTAVGSLCDSGHCGWSWRRPAPAQWDKDDTLDRAHVPLGPGFQSFPSTLNATHVLDIVGPARDFAIPAEELPGVILRLSPTADSATYWIPPALPAHGSVVVFAPLPPDDPESLGAALDAEPPTLMISAATKRVVYNERYVALEAEEGYDGDTIIRALPHPIGVLALDAKSGPRRQASGEEGVSGARTHKPRREVVVILPDFDRRPLCAPLDVPGSGPQRDAAQPLIALVGLIASSLACDDTAVTVVNTAGVARLWMDTHLPDCRSVGRVQQGIQTLVKAALGRCDLSELYESETFGVDPTGILMERLTFMSRKEYRSGMSKLQWEIETRM